MHWSETDKGKKFVETAFREAELPEVAEEKLEPGTFTNAQIAAKCAFPHNLAALLMRCPSGDVASRRSILSFAVDME